jgi:hypothetical protein
MRIAWLAVSLVMASTATAQETSVDRPGRIAATAATSTCLGEPRSPQCAAETLLACLTRAEARLCRAVGITDVPPPAEPIQTEYVIERVSVIRPEDVTDDLRGLDWFKPGFALIEVLRRTCPAAMRACLDEEWEEIQVYAKPAGGRWEIVTWRGENQPDGVPDIPDTYRPPPP